ncbi:hypothetical protein [Parasitella parasitica]|uniref:Uncharacterized protein n=1 Tax=Parasitella parasitica TaxID=35722 RepID=A0A0B7N131_9FUNG|nr:hypothetical protein [Parasitella parasitica]
MSFTSLKNKIISFVGTIAKQVYTSFASSTIHAFHKALPATGTKGYEILEVFYDPDDALAFELDFAVVGGRVHKTAQVGYFSNALFSSVQQAKDAMKFDLDTAMTTVMPGMYQNPRNVYGIMSPHQQERLDRQEYEFIEYSQELNDVFFKQKALQTNTALIK